MTKTKPKKISISAFDNIMKETRVPDKIIEWNGIEIVVKHTLSLQDMITFTESVVGSCFVEETNRYMPEVKPFVIKCCALTLYANFSLPENSHHKYDLVYNTDAFDVVVQHINTKQFNEIIEAIDVRLENIAQANIEAVNAHMNSIAAAFEQIQNQFEESFSGIGSEDIKKTMSALGENGFSEEKLVQAYMEQAKLKEPAAGE